MKYLPVKLLSLSVCALLTVAGARAQEPCSAFKWDAARERSVFATTAQPLAATPTAETALPVSSGALYDLTLVPQTRITAKEPIAPKSHFEGAFGGFVRVHVVTAGRYRIALGAPGWIDALSEGTALSSVDFSGAKGCNAPHKIVVFALPAGEILLQLSGIAQPHLRLSVTTDSAP